MVFIAAICDYEDSFKIEATCKPFWTKTEIHRNPYHILFYLQRWFVFLKVMFNQHKKVHFLSLFGNKYFVQMSAKNT